MKYDFDQPCDRRNTNCAKWDSSQYIFGSNEVIPMWVADMDFPVAQPIVDALRKRAEHPYYGYTQPGPSINEAIVERMSGNSTGRSNRNGSSLPPVWFPP